MYDYWDALLPEAECRVDRGGSINVSCLPTMEQVAKNNFPLRKLRKVSSGSKMFLNLKKFRN